MWISIINIKCECWFSDLSVRQKTSRWWQTWAGALTPAKNNSRLPKKAAWENAFSSRAMGALGVISSKNLDQVSIIFLSKTIEKSQVFSRLLSWEIRWDGKWFILVMTSNIILGCSRHLSWARCRHNHKPLLKNFRNIFFFLLFKTTELIYSLEEKRNAWLKLQVRISHDYVDDEAEILPEVICRHHHIQGHQMKLKLDQESKDSRI